MPLAVVRSLPPLSSDRPLDSRRIRSRRAPNVRQLAVTVFSTA